MNILESNKLYYNSKEMTRDTERQYVITKVLSHKEDT